MKEKLLKKTLYLLIPLIIGATIYFAKTIGDKATRYQAYKALQSVVSLSRPAHIAIDMLQMERNLATLYLIENDPTLFNQITSQYQLSDQDFQIFSKKLQKTEILLLSIPDSEFSKIHQEIIQARTRLNQGQLTFSENFHFYNDIIARFERFLEKMYTYSNDVEFQPLISALIDSGTLKELMAKECSFVSFQLSKENIPRGEFPLIHQMITEQNRSSGELQSSADSFINKETEIVFNSKEYKDLLNLREGLEKPAPNLKGNIYLAKNYQYLLNAFTLHLSKMNLLILDKLEFISKQGKEKTISEILWSSGFGILLIFLLLAVFHFLKNDIFKIK